MRRTQLYLEEPMWKALSIRAKQQQTTVSELVREAVQEKYAATGVAREAAMNALIGIWADRTDLPSTEEYVRTLRRSPRRLQKLK
ncbi:MAG TPA: ribbon-helix-helix protein, CopG family [Terriglobales bacterium]|nr:ribbon-helix-helix protein, CopG family [Terriglobales bacterium]